MPAVPWRTHRAPGFDGDKSDPQDAKRRQQVEGGGGFLGHRANLRYSTGKGFPGGSFVIGFQFNTRKQKDLFFRSSSGNKSVF